MKLKITNKTLFILFLIFTLPILVLFVGSGMGAFAPFGSEEMLYITGNDVIKNFQFKEFNGEPVTAGGTVASLGNRLKFESGAFWTASPDDVDLQYIYEEGNKTYIYYRVSMKNKINIYTNVRLDDATETDLNTVDEVLDVGTYRHYGCFGGDPLYGWDGEFNWAHYDFGNVLTHNSKYNKFDGNLVMDFDIAQSPLPDIFTDEDGRKVTKDFDYIAISAITITDSKHGKLSEDQPTIETILPAEYDTELRDDVSGGEAQSDCQGFSFYWDPMPSMSPPFKSAVLDLGTQPQTVGSSLNPKTKDGSAIWDSKETGASMSDCQFTYNLGSISPLVYEWSSTLTYYKQTLVTVDVIDWILFVPVGTHVELSYDGDEITSETRPVALHVTNRYIQAEIMTVFNIWTCYEIEPLETDDPELQLPSEYYDELLWQTTVDGFGGGTIYKGDTGIDWIMVLIILIVVLVGIYLVWKFIIKPRQKKKEVLDIIRASRGVS